MILEITAEQVEQLNDTDLRTLVAYLCEREVRSHGHPVSAVTWGGHQNAGDGGIDVRVSLPAGATITGYVPKASTGLQVKAQDMPRKASPWNWQGMAGLTSSSVPRARFLIRP